MLASVKAAGHTNQLNQKKGEKMWERQWRERAAAGFNAQFDFEHTTEMSLSSLAAAAMQMAATTARVAAVQECIVILADENEI